jgi:hypothetical protein
MNHDSLIVFWAKLGKETWPEKYHPVICHLIDVAAVTANLWDQVIRTRLRQWVSDRLGLDEQSCGRWLAFWIGAHDIGKVSPCPRTAGSKTPPRSETSSGTLGSRPPAAMNTTVRSAPKSWPTNWPTRQRGPRSIRTCPAT